jgi:endoglycosylceramidase
MGGGVCDIGEPNPKYAGACKKWHEKRFWYRTQDAERLGLPFFLSEFGACLTEGPCTTEIKQVTDESDRYLVGWAYWQFKFFEDLTTSAGTGSEGFYNSDGTLQDWKVKALTRSYLMAT